MIILGFFKRRRPLIIDSVKNCISHLNRRALRSEEMEKILPVNNGRRVIFDHYREYIHSFSDQTRRESST